MSNACFTRPLLRHPCDPLQEVLRVAVDVRFFADSRIVFSYRLHGAIEHLQIPAPQPLARVDGLWKHTCCEAFVGLANDTAYREFNFSPSGQWAAYDFSDYRQRISSDPVIDPPHIVTRRTDGCFELEVTVPFASLTVDSSEKSWQIGLCAVIETMDAENANNHLGYWALFHPCQRPDFHHRKGFILRFERTRLGHQGNVQ